MATPLAVYPIYKPQSVSVFSIPECSRSPTPCLCVNAIHRLLLRQPIPYRRALWLHPVRLRLSMDIGRGTSPRYADGLEATATVVRNAGALIAALRTGDPVPALHRK